YGIIPVRVRVFPRIRTVAEFLYFFRGEPRRQPAVFVNFIKHRSISSRISYPGKTRRRVKTQIVVEIDFRLTNCSAFGGDENYPIGRLRAIDSRRRILQDSDTLNVCRVEP